MLRNSFVLAMILAIFWMAAPVAAADDDEERLQALEREVAELKAAIAELRNLGLAEDRLAEVERRLGLLAEEIEDLKVGDAAVVAMTAESGEPYGLGPAAAKVYQKDHGVSIGGYGEALLQLYDDEKDDGDSSGKVDQFDFLRAVVYVGYKFSDSWVLNTEIEFEHASTSEGGSASVEFAYLDYLHSDGFNLRTGLVLLPMGWLNELHEPTVYLGATRPRTESVIIPTTWRENGIGAWGEFGAFNYRTYVVNGLDASGFSAQGLRGGRQKGAKAKAEDFAWVGRLDYSGVPGLIVGAAGYIGDSGQDLADTVGQSIPVGTSIVDLHAEYRFRGLRLRGLYSQATLDDVAQLNQALGYSGAQSVGEKLEGGYLEAGYDVLAGRNASSLIPYVRWERLNTQQEVPVGWSANPANDQKLLTLGLAYQPISQLIFKAEYLNVDNEAGTGVDQFNLALGYIFEVGVVKIFKPSLALVVVAAASMMEATVLVSVEESLELAFPGATTVRETLFLTDDQLRDISELSGTDVSSALVTRYVATGGDGAVVGHAYLDTHRVRTLPETLMIVVATDDTVARVEVVVFREPVEYMPRDGWYRQYDGEDLDDDLVLERGIRPVTGATLTARATTEAVRRVLSIHEVVSAGGAP